MLKVKTLTATIGILLSACSISAKADLAVLETVTWGASTYHLIEAATWDESEARAVELGGHLVTIDNKQENDFIYTYWGRDGLSTEFNASYLWIGLNDAKDEGDFVWSSGDEVSYTHFNPGEPNGSIRENYVHFWTTGTTAGFWNDLSGSRGADYANVGVFGVVEINNLGSNSNLTARDVPAPFLLSLGLPLLFIPRRKANS